MRSSLLTVLMAPLLASCAGSGGVPPAPLVWHPGTYYLEADVTAARRETFSADLYVEPDGTLRLDNHRGGVCGIPTPPERERDRRRRVRTFRCGDATWVLRPGSATVNGDIVARVEELYWERICVSRGANGACAETTRIQRSRMVNKSGRVRVQSQG